MNANAAKEGLAWLRDSALPLWLEHGLDGRRGGFYEALDQGRARNTADFRRLRVLTRQIYVFAAALRLGIPNAREGLDHGLAFLSGPACHPEGGYANRFDMDGRTIDPTRDLYDLAFAAFALAHAYDVTGDSAVRDEAARLAEFIDRQMRHPAGGFVEALPVPRSPRRQNPHMHLFEAALAWAELDRDGLYPALADELGKLFRTRFFQRATATLPEYYDDSLTPLPGEEGRIIEPGHHFEWVWLLHHAKRLDILAPGGEAEALYRFARVSGFDRETGLPLGEVAPDGAVLATPTRLWTVTEWIKAEAVTPGPDRDARVAQGWSALQRFLDTPTPGLWHERWDPDADGFLPGPAPATSLYHIVLAIEVMLETSGKHPRPFARGTA